MSGGVLPYEIGPDGHVMFPEETDLRINPIGPGGGDADVLYFRHQVYDGARALEFIHAYMTMMIDHRAHDLLTVSCMEEAIHTLLGQMFEGHPLVVEAEEEYIAGEDQYETLDRTLAVQHTLMMQTMMGLSDLIIGMFEHIAGRENFITHQAIALAERGGMLSQLVGEIEIPEGRMEMLHQPRMGWIHRVKNDYVQKAREIAPDVWVDGNAHMWSRGLGESELCPVIRQFTPEGIEFHDDGRVVLRETTEGEQE